MQHRELLLADWEKLDWRHKLDLLGRSVGAFWDALTKVGVDPGIARCAADDLLANTSEADLLAMGIAAVPRPPEVNALLDSSAKRCGVTQAQLDAAAAA